MQINRDRFLTNLTAMAAVGLLPDEDGGGRDRRPFSPADREARALFTQLAEDAGLHVQGNATISLSGGSLSGFGTNLSPPNTIDLMPRTCSMSSSVSLPHCARTASTAI